MPDRGLALSLSTLPGANSTGLQESVSVVPEIESARTVAYGILKRTPLNRGMVQCDRGIAAAIRTIAIRPIHPFTVVRFNDHGVDSMLVVFHSVSLVCVCVCVCRPLLTSAVDDDGEDGNDQCPFHSVSPCVVVVRVYCT